MELAKHCNLCENQITDFKVGTTCSLTNRKPDFNKTCPNIKLADKFETILKKANIEYKKVGKSKASAYLNFWVYISFGLAVIVSGYLIGKYAWESGVISTVPLIIMCAGFPLIVLGIGSIVKHRQEMEVAEMKKSNVDNVLAEYGIEYDIDIKFGREYHGTQEITADLHIKGKN